jgi:hypothetical protein
MINTKTEEREREREREGGREGGREGRGGVCVCVWSIQYVSYIILFVKSIDMSN